MRTQDDRFASRRMTGEEHKPGDYVLHPTAGPCRVVGVRAHPQLGAALAIERVRPLTGAVFVPMRKLGTAGLRRLEQAEAEALASAPINHRDHSWKARKRWL